ncbi:MAG: hypothetical protein R6W82_08190 [bacterium]
MLPSSVVLTHPGDWFEPRPPTGLLIGTGEVYGRDSSIGVLYIRTTRGPYGIGILKSMDGGATWTKSLDWSYDQRRGVLDIATYQGWFSHFVVAHPGDTTRVMVAGVDVFTSWDGGRTFEQGSYWYRWYQGILPPQGPTGPPDHFHADHHAFAGHPSAWDRVFLASGINIVCLSAGGRDQSIRMLLVK